MVQYKTVLESFQKSGPLNYTSQFVIINYTTFIYPIESGKCGQKEKKLNNLNISKKKELFIVFEGLSFGEKNKQ